MKQVVDILEKVKEIADEWVDIITVILPIGWVLACFDGKAEHLLAGEFVRFFGYVFAACIFSFFLLGFGLRFSGLTLKPDEHAGLPIGKWKALGIEILILLWITFYIPSINPSDVI